MTGTAGTVARVVALLVFVEIEVVEGGASGDTGIDVADCACSWDGFCAAGDSASTSIAEATVLVASLGLSVTAGSLEDEILAFSSGLMPVCLLVGSSTNTATPIFRRRLLDLAARIGKGSSGIDSQGT